MRGGEPALERCRRGHRADTVPHDGVRHVHARPGAQPCTPAEVDVLEVHEHRLVEAAQLEHPFPAHQHRSSVRAERGHDGRSRDSEVEPEAGQRLTQQRAPPQGHAGVHEPLPRPVELLRVGGEAVRVLVERGGEELEAARVERDVVVGAQDVVRPDGSRALVVEVAEPPIRADQHARAVGAGERRAAVRRRRIHDDHLRGWEALLVEAGEAVSQHPFSLPVADHNGDARSRHSSPGRRTRRRGAAPAAVASARARRSRARADASRGAAAGARAVRGRR